MKLPNLPSLLVILTLLSNHIFAAILPVPTVYTTIQIAINSSANGDTVLVDPGVYYENINMNGKNILLASLFLTSGDTAYISSTILDGDFSGRVLTIAQGENATCQVAGFTFRNGDTGFESGLQRGGGVLIDASSPVIRNCVIRNNTSVTKGGGIAMIASDGKVLNCTIRDNVADNAGGGVYMEDCLANAEVAGCIIKSNSISCYCTWTESGGGVSIYHSGKLTNCLVSGNSAPNASVGGGGVFCDWGDFFGNQRIFITGCTIVGNSASGAGGTAQVITGGQFRNCIVWGNTDGTNNVSNNNGNYFDYSCTDPILPGPGNIGSDPQFISAGNGNYRLSPGSPCINAGLDAYNDQLVDLDGNPRLSGIIDMGAYEYATETGFTVQIGSGSDGLYQYPVNTCDFYGYTQQIYDSSEFAAGGADSGFISRIRFFYKSGAPAFSLWNSWKIYLGNTPRSQFNSTSDWFPLDSLTLVYSGTVPAFIPDNWNEIVLHTPYYYAGNNLVVAVDENAFGSQCSAVFAGFGVSSARGLAFSSNSVNPDPASPPPALYGPDYSINQKQFFFSSSIGLIEGVVTRSVACTDPVPGATVSAGGYLATTDPSGVFQLPLPAGTYTVTASDGNVSQSLSSILVTAGDTLVQDFCLPIYFAPPVQLEVEATGALFHNAHLTWLEPGSVADQYLSWGDQTFAAGSLGYGNMIITFSMATRWPVEDIAPYAGAYLKAIRFVPAEATAQYTLKVWKGADASTLLHSQAVPILNINAWNEIALTTPIQIDGTEELWFGLEIFQTEGYPASLAPGPAIAGKGDMFNSGSGWISMKNSWEFNYNWRLQGFVSQSPVPLAPAVPLSARALPVVQVRDQGEYRTNLKPEIKPFALNTVSDSFSSGSTLRGRISGAPPASASSLLTGYNVYRDDVLVGSNLPDLFFDDPGLAKGTYSYEVSALYDLGESERIGPVTLQVYTCFPPTSVSVPGATLGVNSAVVNWTPSLLSANPEWVVEYGASGFNPGAGTQMHVSATPQVLITGLSAGVEYDVYVHTFCSSTDTSAGVFKRFRTHYLECPLNAVAEAESCGDTVNNGCLMPVPAFGTIACGDTVCGSAWLLHQNRDDDWYSFTLTETTDVTVSVLAEFASQLGLKNSPCPSGGFTTASWGSPGWVSQVQAQLAAGTYYIYLSPTFNGNVTCDSLSRYILTMHCTTCLTPTQLTVTGITGTSADLGWTSNAVEWEIEWGTSGFGLGNGTRVTGVTQNPFTLTGLTEGYSYDVYVRSACPGDEYSAWGGPATFFVPCQYAASLPFSEDFSTQAYYTTPLCWQPMAEGAAANWIVEPTANAGGGYPELRFYSYPWSGGINMLASPVINTAGRAELNLQFNIYLDINDSNTSFEVYTTSDGGQTWNTVWNYFGAGLHGPATEYVTITNSDVGSPYFRLAFVVNGNSWNLNSLTLDNILLDGILLTGNLDGYLYECNTPNPLEGVLVQAGAETTYTDNTGYFAFNNLPQGSYDVVCSLAGYVTDTVTGVQVWDGQTTGISGCLEPSGPPVNRTLENLTLTSGQDVCYDATQVITVAGGGATFIVQPGASAIMIAGLKISYLPGTSVAPGGYMLGRIAPGGPFCSPPESPVAHVDTRETLAGHPAARIYPNPSTGRFMLDLSGLAITGEARIDIYNMQGETVLSVRHNTGETIELSLTGRSPGIYLVRIVSGSELHTARVMISR